MKVWKYTRAWKSAVVKVTAKKCGIKFCEHWKIQSKSDISYMPGKLWDKVIDHTDEPVVQFNVPAVKDASLDDNNNDCK